MSCRGKAIMMAEMDAIFAISAVLFALYSSLAMEFAIEYEYPVLG